MSKDEVKQDRTKFISLMIRDGKSPVADRANPGRKGVGPAKWTVHETEPFTAKGLVKMEAKRQKLLLEGKEVILVKSVLKLDDPQFGVSRRAKRAQKRSLRPMQRMLGRRQKRLDEAIGKEFSERETEKVA